jgi:hypothetical protein
LRKKYSIPRAGEKQENYFEVAGGPKMAYKKDDGLVKSPAAALRFNFVVAAHLASALPSSVFARLASRAFCETIIPVTFYEIIKGVPQRLG